MFVLHDQAGYAGFHGIVGCDDDRKDFLCWLPLPHPLNVFTRTNNEEVRARGIESF